MSTVSVRGGDKIQSRVREMGSGLAPIWGTCRAGKLRQVITTKPSLSVAHRQLSSPSVWVQGSSLCSLKLPEEH